MSYTEAVIREVIGIIVGGKLRRTGNKYKKPKPVSE